MASQTDGFGNTDTATLSLTLDTTAPAVAITSAGGPTNQPALTISGTGEAGATVTLFDNGTPLQLPTGDGRSERPVVRQRHAQQWQQLADRAGHRRRRQHQPHQQRGDLYAEHRGRRTGA